MRAYIILGILLGIILISGCLGAECPDDNKPVCGANGVTYKNACLAAKANVNVASQGACKVCSDSDGGRDIFQASGATDATGSYSDKCAGDRSVEERYCDGGSVLSAVLPCPEGYACEGGACVSVPCLDSDGGLNEDVKGAVTSGGATVQDSCASAEAVSEYYCDNGKAASKDIICGTGMACSGGQCVKAQCTDSDGKSTATKGTAKSGSQTLNDACADANSVTEYFCESDQLKSEKIACASGFGCQDGKCVQNLCADSDGGKNAQVKGTATYGTTTLTDSCYSSSAVLEHFCATDTSTGSEQMNCGSGNECFDGRCRPVQCTVNQTNIDDTDERRQLAAFDDSDELRLYVGDTVEINDGMFLKLNSVSGNTSTFRLYLSFADFMDGDQECSFSLDEGDSDNDVCGENTGDVTVNTVDDTDDFVEMNLDEYFAVQYFSQDGVFRDWTNNPVCQDDEVAFDSYEADFYPYLDTQSSGLNLDGRTIEFLGVIADIVEVTTDTLTIEVAGDELDLQDGEEFEYLDEQYTPELTFTDGGLAKLVVEPS